MLLEGPPAGKMTTTILIPASETMPGMIEEWKLTTIGRVLSRTEFKVMDGHRLAGKAGKRPRAMRFMPQDFV